MGHGGRRQRHTKAVRSEKCPFTGISVQPAQRPPRLLLGAMVLLVLGIGLDFYVIARVILANRWLSVLLTLVVVSLFVSVWFLLPRLGR